MLRLTLLFVKTARAILYQGYMPALAVDGMVADELTTVDGVSPPPGKSGYGIRTGPLSGLC